MVRSFVGRWPEGDGRRLSEGLGVQCWSVVRTRVSGAKMAFVRRHRSALSLLVFSAMKSQNRPSGRTYRKRGFSLVELVVVIAIIAALIILTLPAVESVVESGRRTTCSAKQALLARHMSRYDTLKGYLPGWRNDITVLGMPGTASWLVELLPHMASKDLYQGIVDGRIWYGPGVEFGGGVHELNGILRCPSVPVQKGYRDSATDYNANGAGASTVTQNYVTKVISGFRKEDGVLGDNSSGVFVRMSDVQQGDGLSNTLLVADAGAPRNFIPVSRTQIAPDGTSPPNQKFRIPPNAVNNLYNPTATPAMNMPVQLSGIGLCFGFDPFDPNAAQPVLNATGNGVQPKSTHPGGVVVAFADGSSRFLKGDLLPHVYGHLVTSRSVYNANGPTGQKYSTNSTRANTFLDANSY